MKYLFKSIIISFILLFVFISGCGHSNFAYIYNPKIIHKNGWDIEFYQFQVEFSKTKKQYVGIEGYSEDTLYEFSIIFSTKNESAAETSFIKIDNVNIYIGEDKIPIETIKLEENLKPLKVNHFNHVNYGLIKTTGPPPNQTYVELDIIIYNINTEDEINRYNIETIGTLTKFYKLYIKEFIEGH